MVVTDVPNPASIMEGWRPWFSKGTGESLEEERKCQIGRGRSCKISGGKNIHISSEKKS